MFTGLVEAVGTVERLERRGPGLRLRLRAELGPLVEGESIAVNGACLTVTQQDSRGFTADVSLETAARTNLGTLGVSAQVNLERALRLGDRLGGHLVSGHVDATVVARQITAVGAARRVVLELPPTLVAFVAPKGSVTLDGVSLTVNDVRLDEFEVMLIPHTLAATTLAELVAGRVLNLEVDLLARYVVACLGARRLGGGGTADAAGDLDVPAVTDQGLIEALKRSGLM